MEQGLDYDVLVLEDTIYLSNVEVFKYRLEYLQFRVGTPAFDALNQRNLREVQTRKSYAMNTLYGNAVQAYLRGSKGLPYEYDSKIIVTMNQDNVFSAYLEEYVYTGGAHGNTTRQPFTYDTKTGQNRTLCSFMKQEGCLTCISNNIINQIRTSGQENQYFSNYADLVPQTFEAKEFYVKPDGVVVYFGLYEIAPYASGIREFTIPFNAC
ncbi:MAG: DUF3298 domain-containing protein [Coprobacillaceae bacterium]